MLAVDATPDVGHGDRLAELLQQPFVYSLLAVKDMVALVGVDPVEPAVIGTGIHCRSGGKTHESVTARPVAAWHGAYRRDIHSEFLLAEMQEEDDEEDVSEGVHGMCTNDDHAYVH